jgi:hypothetical protein
MNTASKLNSPNALWPPMPMAFISPISRVRHCTDMVGVHDSSSRRGSAMTAKALSSQYDHVYHGEGANLVGDGACSRPVDGPFSLW